MKKLVTIVCSSLLLTISNTLVAQITFTTVGSGTWTPPAGVKAALVECWGAGGGGGRIYNIYGVGTAGAGGGGGGAYASSIVSITGSPIAYQIGTGGYGGTNVTNGFPAGYGEAGGDTFWNNNQIKAAGGLGGGNANAINVFAGTGGAGGSIENSIGTFRFNGGNGSDGFVNGNGGGGGGGAGNSSNGGNATTNLGAVGGISAGSYTQNGGSGGFGGIFFSNSSFAGGSGNFGSNAGGGGGGSAFTPIRNSGSQQGGNGGNGLIVVTYPTITGLSSTSGCGTTSFTISGTNFTTAAGAPIVTIGGIAASSVTFQSATSLVVFPAAGSSGIVSVKSDYGTFADEAFTYSSYYLAPTIITQPSAPFICNNVGASTTVSVAAVGVSPSYVWQSRIVTSANPNPVWTDIVANANYSGQDTTTLTITKTATVFATGLQFRVLINSLCGQVASTPVPLTVLTTVKAGLIVAPASVCLGSGITFSLTKYAGTSVQWQSALNATSLFSDIPGATESTYTIEGATMEMNKSYRAIVTNNCGTTTTATTAIKTIKVDPTSVAGIISGGGVVCADGGGTLKLTGYVGKIQWQYSTDDLNYINAPAAATGQTIPFSTTSIRSISSTYVVTGISTNLYFRAKVTSGSCSSAYSTPIHFTIGTVAVVGTITGGTTLCSRTGTTLNLSNALGTITWQKSTNYTATNPTWTDTTNHGLFYSTGSMTYNTAFRAKVSIGSCSTVYSNTDYVYLIPKPVAKTITKNSTSPTGATNTAAICTSDTSKILTAGIGTSGVIQWQWSTESTITGFTDIAGSTNTSYTISNPSSGANYYRIKLTNTCGEVVFGTAVTVYYQSCTAKVIGETSFKVAAYPNPYEDKFNLSLITSSEDKVGVRVYDITGRLIESNELTPTDVNDFGIGTNYPSGVYNVVVTQADEVKIVRVIKD